MCYDADDTVDGDPWACTRAGNSCTCRIAKDHALAARTCWDATPASCQAMPEQGFKIRIIRYRDVLTRLYGSNVALLVSYSTEYLIKPYAML